MSSSKAIVENIFQICFSGSNFITVPGLTSDQDEIDHFIEVQHITSYFLDSLNIEKKPYFEIPFGYIFDLATAVNEHRNLFKISKQLKQVKQNTPLDQYSTNSEILKYWNSKTNEESTVGNDVTALVGDMIARKGAYSHYTNVIGQLFQLNLIEPMLKVNPGQPIYNLESFYQRHNQLKVANVFNVTSFYKGYNQLGRLGVANVFNTTPLFRALEVKQQGSLLDILNKEKNVPAKTDVVAVHPNLSETDLKSLRDISTLVTYISLYSAIEINEKMPDWRISDAQETANFINAKADSYFRSITRHLAGFLRQESGATYEFRKTTTTAELHTELLNTMFKDYKFPDSVKTQLDSVLTNISNQLNSLKIKWEQLKQNFGFFVCFYYFEEVLGLPGVNIPKLRIFYLHIENSSWSFSIGKSSAQKEEFKMLYDDFIFTMDEALMDKYREVFNKHIDEWAGDQLDKIKKLASPAVINVPKVNS